MGFILRILEITRNDWFALDTFAYAMSAAGSVVLALLASVWLRRIRDRIIAELQD